MALKFTHLEVRFAILADPSLQLEAKVGHEVSAFVSDRVAAFRALERGLGSFIAERRGSLVIPLGGLSIPRAASPPFPQIPHPPHCPRIPLPRPLHRPP